MAGEAAGLRKASRGGSGVTFAENEGPGLFVRVLAKVARFKAGFSSSGQAIILDANMSTKLAGSLRERGYNVRSVQEIFGRTDIRDAKILDLARTIDARVLTHDVGRQLDGGFFERGIVIDQRVRSTDGVSRLLDEALK
jgi:Domain of unknown function (DUF5615)